MLFDCSSLVKSIVKCSLKYIDTDVIIYNSCVREKKLISKQFEEKNLGDRLIALDAHALKFSQGCSDFYYNLCCNYLLEDILNDTCMNSENIANSVITGKFHELQPKFIKLLQEGHIEIYAENNDGEGFSVSESEISQLLNEKIDFESFSKDLLNSMSIYHTSLPNSLSITEKTDNTIIKFVEEFLPEFDLKSIWCKGFEEISNFYLKIYSTSINTVTNPIQEKTSNEPTRHSKLLSEFLKESSKVYQELFEHRRNIFTKKTEATFIEFIDLEIDFFERCQYDLENYEASIDGFANLGLEVFSILDKVINEIGYEKFHFATKRKIEFLTLQKEKINKQDVSDLDLLFGSVTDEVVKPLKNQRLKKKKESLADISQKSFFKKIRNGKLTQLEIHNKTEDITDAFQLDKLKILLKDFEFYLFVEKEDHESSYSSSDIQTAIDRLNKSNREIPTVPIKDFQKGDDGKVRLVETDRKVLNKEELLYPYEFFSCYQFKAFLEEEIKRHNFSSRDYSKYNIKGTQAKYNIDYNQLVKEIANTFDVNIIDNLLNTELHKLKKINREGYEENKGDFFNTYKSRADWVENTILICDNEFIYTKKLAFKTAIKWCEEWREKYLPLFDPYSPEERKSMYNAHKPVWQELSNNNENKLSLVKSEILTDTPFKEEIEEDRNSIAIQEVIEDYMEQFLKDGNLSQQDYGHTLKVFISYFSGKSYQLVKSITIKGRVKKNFSFECGKIFKELSPGNPIKFEYLILLKNSFNIYGKEIIEESKFQKSNLYKYLTAKK